MIEIDHKRVQCPNCPELLENVTRESDGTDALIFWFHKYENFCVDIVDEIYIKSNSLYSINYVNMLREAFKIEL